MLLACLSVRGLSANLWGVSALTVANVTRGDLLQLTFHLPLSSAVCLRLAVPSNRRFQTSEKHRPISVERNATEISKFIDGLCNPNAFRKRPDFPLTNKQIQRMDAAAGGFLDSLNLSSENITKEAISQFSKEVYKMSSTQLAQLLKETFQRQISHPLLLEHICTALNDRALPSSPYHICLIAFCLAKHSHLDKPLLNRIKEEFLLCAKTEYISNSALSFAVFAFAFFRLSDQSLWRQIIKTSEVLANRSELQTSTLMQCVNSLAAVNVDPKLVSSIVEMTKNLRKDGKFFSHWLRLVHSLAILNSLGAQMAESVLNNRFFKLLTEAQQKEEISEHLVQWNFICFRNIATTARLELPRNEVPPIDDGLFLPDKDPKSFSLVRDIKRGFLAVDQKQHPLLERFELMFRLVAPLNSHSTLQEWHKTGAFLEGRCFVDTEQRQLIPLRYANGNSNAREIAVLLLMDRHFTQSIGPSEEGTDRPTGINQMNIRHLKKAGIHPVVFTEQHFRELGDNERSQIKFIREKILSLSEEFHHNEWAEG